MFGPNAISSRTTTEYMHHRGHAYRALLRSTTEIFRERFGISDEWDVIFMTGSGTLANESVFFSLKKPARMVVSGDPGDFTKRLVQFSRLYGVQDEWEYEHQFMVRYETGEGRLVQPRFVQCRGAQVADCISSFPYYDPPEGADIWTTVSSKQIGALPIMGIVVIKRTAWQWLRSEKTYSYMNLARWRWAYEEKYESPHSPSIPLLEDLNLRLQRFSLPKLKQDIIDRRTVLEAATKTPQRFLGKGPVVTVPHDMIPERLADMWSLYKSRMGYQFFLYSGSTDFYVTFAREWRNAKA